MSLFVWSLHKAKQIDAYRGNVDKLYPVVSLQI